MTVDRLPIRVRLVAGFSVAMFVLLTGAGAFVYWRVEYALDRGLDTELAQASAVVAPLVGTDGIVGSPAAADATGLAWQVLGTDGEVLDSGGPAPAKPLLSATQLDTVGGSGHRTFDVGSLLPISDEPYRVRVSPLADRPGGRAAYLLVGVRRDHRDEALRELLVQLGIAGFVALAIASVVGYLLARLALDPVERYRRRAAEIAAGAVDLRLDVPPVRDDEITRLGHTLNEMLTALELALDRERQFVNDASHELRTPLTLLKSRIQLARRRTRSVAEHERTLDELEVDVTRLADLAEQLLDLSRDRAEPDGTSDVGDVVSSVLERWRLARPDRAGEISLRTPPQPALARLDPRVLERVVTNLLDNAFAHGRPPVRVRVRSAGDHTVLEVADAGLGMPPELLGQATRRFHRAPDARSRPGAGLGLSIVEQLVTGAGGELRVCHGGCHTSNGSPVALDCDHDDAMTVTVILPVPS
ncbi:MAG TPA: ATP-binding protein [Nocardioides sp.]|uniref:sensor histidine kinase n=1 Tax=Nocardioides sp. TaxID=35761 RepID=UPI002E30A381|nr:ATP-binding protein [Nocardioides sp.]HEX5089767.1 ATP-binding protein [Nocardioides sp.]